MFYGLDLMRSFPAPDEKQVAIANMQTGPYNRWAFRNMRRLLPTANIWRGSGSISKLPEAPTNLADIVFHGAAGTERTIGEWVANSYNDGLVVLHHGNLVAEHYASGVEPNEPHLCMSVSKSFTGSLTSNLIEQGLLATSDLVTDILPELRGSAYDGAEVRHLLDMTVGMEYDEDYDNPISDIALLDVAAGWREHREGHPDNLRDYMKTMRPAGKHGIEFHYVSTNTDVLGWVQERVSGLAFANLMSNEIWQRMGAEFDAYITVDRFGAPQTDGGLCVTTRDLARFGQLHLQHGVMNGQRIVSEEWIRDFRQNGDVDAWNCGNFADMMPAHHYRSKWYTDRTDSHRPFFGIGIHGQFVFVDPSASVVVAKHSSHPSPVDPEFFADCKSAFRTIAHALLSSEVS